MWDFGRISKVEQRQLDEQAWQKHTRLIQDLEFDPYEGCVCDVVGLPKFFQIVRDPDGHKDYAHRGDCLAYPDPDAWDSNLQDTGVQNCMLPRIRQFRYNARTKRGAKKFTQKALRDLMRRCGARGLWTERSIPCGWHCCCDIYTLREQPSPEAPARQKCNVCSKECCRCCSPECYGLARDDARATHCANCGHVCCPQCKPDCPSRSNDFAPYPIGVAQPSSFRHIPTSASDEESQPLKSYRAPRQPKMKRSIATAVLSLTQPRSTEVRRQAMRPSQSSSRPKSRLDRVEESDSETPASQCRSPPRKRKSKVATSLSSESVDESDQENMPVRYDPRTIATDILRVAGIHPTLPPLNAHLRHATGLEDMTKSKQRSKKRKTEP